MVTCGRGCRWKDGKDTGHCANCHKTFLSLDAFDRHQSIKNGKTVCQDPGRGRWFDSIMQDGTVYYFKR